MREQVGSASLRMGTSAGRWVIAAILLGSGVAFIAGSMVNVALPAISTGVGTKRSDLQWVLTATGCRFPRSS